MKKIQISLFSEKVQIILKITKKNWNSVSLYPKKLPILFGIKIKIFVLIYKNRLNMMLLPLPPNFHFSRQKIIKI